MLLSLYWQLQMAQAWSVSQHGDNIMRLRPRFKHVPGKETLLVVYALDKEQGNLSSVVLFPSLSFLKEGNPVVH